MSNITFTLVFSAMMITIMYLNGCNAMESMREPTMLDCAVNCTPDGDCGASIKAVGEVNARQRKVTLDTPTQTKVGLEGE